MLDDGTVFDRMTKHLVGTCRFTYNYALAHVVLGADEHRVAAAHGLRFLREHHKREDGGYAWVLSGQAVVDGTYHCYGHAFVLLAAAGARKAGAEGAAALMDDIWELLESRFWDPDASLYVDEIAAGDWSKVDAYRGQNANMHMCEAMLAAWEASGEARYLDRAALLARRICQDLAASAGGLVWEHYKTDWTHDWNYNKDDPQNLFRPYGYLPGHFTEWSKLLLILNRHRPSDWLVPKAEMLFDAAMKRAYVPDTGAINYTFAPEGTILDTDQYYWGLFRNVRGGSTSGQRNRSRQVLGLVRPCLELCRQALRGSRVRRLVSHSEIATAKSTATKRARRPKRTTTRWLHASRFYRAWSSTLEQLKGGVSPRSRATVTRWLHSLRFCRA